MNSLTTASAYAPPQNNHEHNKGSFGLKDNPKNWDIAKILDLNSEAYSEDALSKLFQGAAFLEKLKSQGLDYQAVSHELYSVTELEIGQSADPDSILAAEKNLGSGQVAKIEFNSSKKRKIAAVTVGNVNGTVAKKPLILVLQRAISVM